MNDKVAIFSYFGPKKQTEELVLYLSQIINKILKILKNCAPFILLSNKLNPIPSIAVAFIASIYDENQHNFKNFVGPWASRRDASRSFGSLLHSLLVTIYQSLAYVHSSSVQTPVASCTRVNQ